ncbi:spermidine synthase [Ruania albidiflava]|uniref:spermidine synthase n=1 Tax=Ruania albidiflava TaxID=366586 RepID=UPI0003B43794|nr:fused MFS/spermidine synthase [Ruania albidiflava]
MHRLPSGPISTSHATVELTTDKTDPNGVMLLIDGAESSYLDLSDPTHLVFEYMQQMMAVLEETMPPDRVRAVHLGGAGCALPRAVAARWPRSRQIAVEWDALLARYVREWFDLPRAPLLRIRVADAREATESITAGSKDVVLRDVFVGREPPEHVRTVEFTRAVASALAEGGVYLVNTADRPPLTFARREAATVAEVFEHVLVIAEPGVLKGRRYGNVVIAAADRALPAPALDRRMRALPVPATVLDRAASREFIGTFQPFTDPPHEVA